MRFEMPSGMAAAHVRTLVGVLALCGGIMPVRGADPVHRADPVPAQAQVATQTAAVAPVIEAEDAWLRWLPGGVPAAGYVTLTNTGSTTLELVGVSSPDYAEASMHQTLDNHGMSEMRPVASLTLKPHGTVRFAEGGYHLMLMHAKRELHQHDRVEIVFRFSDGRTMPVPFDVRSGLGG